MPIQKDGKTYYTLDEVSKRLDARIEQNAQELLKDMRRAQREFETQVEYV